VAALMAMLFMVVFSALALGFYATVNTSAQVSANQRNAIEAMVTAESAIAFIKYHLNRLDVPDSIPAADQFEEAYMQLSGNLDNTANLNGGVVGYAPGVITIPEKDYVYLDKDKRKKFSVKIEQAGDVLVGTFTGVANGAKLSRAIEVKFGKAQNASNIFNFGVASKGTIATSGNSRVIGATDPTKGSIMSTSLAANPIDIQGKEVSGDLTTSNPSASVTFKTGSSIGGTTAPGEITTKHIHKGEPAPEFPEIDTTVYSQYAKNLYLPGLTTYTNTYVKPNTNPSLSNCTIKGVFYVDVPNKVTISGNVTLQCVIVGPSKPAVNVSTNQINIIGNATCLPVSDLAKGYDVLNDPRNEVQKLTGAFIIAPGFSTILGGNMGTVGGSIITSKFTMIGTASGTIQGSIIVQDDQPTLIGGTAAITIASTGTTAYPAGVTFGHHYAAVPGSYLELTPTMIKAKSGNPLDVIVAPPLPTTLPSLP
jgi:Tfp pilus assembly protein PilX